MSWQDCDEAICDEDALGIGVALYSRPKDIGGFTVRRLLPAPECRSVGPFVFFDEMGPAEFGPGEGIDVRPHPHIGLATLTYLFDGEILHRDSLGFVQAIRPGAVNLMTAGRGIVHSERTDPALRATGQRLHGLQTWMALPEDLAETDAAFVHHPAESLPRIEERGARMTLVAGDAFGKRSPVVTASPTLYLDIDLDAGTTLGLPGRGERAVYLVAGRVRMGDTTLEAGTMAVLVPGGANLVKAESACRMVLIGGEPVGPRRLWWNFVARDADRIDRAKADWRDGRFPGIEGDAEFIPLPDS